MVMGNCPGSMVPERRRVWVVESRARDVGPVPGMKVEKMMLSPVGDSLVRKPEVVLDVGNSGMRALRVG